MSSCKGLHCDGCKGGGGEGGAGLFLAVAAVAVPALIIYHYRQIIIEVVKIAALVTVSLIGAVAILFVSIAVARVVRARPRQVSYRKIRKRHSAPIKIVRLGTEATSQHRELRERMNDDLAHQAAHTAEDPIGTSR